MSLETIESALLSQGLASKAQFKERLDDLRRVEDGPTRVVTGNPIVSVWTGI